MVGIRPRLQNLICIKRKAVTHAYMSIFFYEFKITNKYAVKA